MSWSLYPVAQFAAHAEAWRRLHAASGGHALLAFDFVAPLLVEFAGGDELLACHETGGQITAMAVLVRSGRASWSTFQPAQAPIGLWLQLPGQPMTQLLGALVKRLPGLALVCAVTQCDPLLAPRPRDSHQVRAIDYIDTARITLAGGFDAYWQGRGKNLRANLKKQRARLAKEGVQARIEVSRASTDVAAAVADFGRLEGAGWKARAGTAVNIDNAQGRYYRAMLEAFCARGAGSIYRYWFDGQLVAMDLCVEDGDSIVVLKTAYDESVPSHYSPTLLMREEACRRLFDEGRFARIEFYGKVMEWHLRWTDEIRALYHMNYYRWPALAFLHTLLHTSLHTLPRRAPSAGPALTPDGATRVH
jgi:CelD/BcsL family acetyltransferase involved in cellulose biosynthesis